MTRSDAHAAVAIGIAECFLCQPQSMAWEQRCDELATAAIEAMQIFIAQAREASAGEAGTAATTQIGVVHEHATRKAGDARG